MSMIVESKTANWITPDKHDYTRSLTEPAFAGLQLTSNPEISEAFAQSMDPVIWRIRDVLEDPSNETHKNWLMFIANNYEIDKLLSKQRKDFRKKYNLSASAFTTSNQRMELVYSAIRENKPVEDIIDREKRQEEQRLRGRRINPSAYDRQPGRTRFGR
jgi:hypothetical protein